MTNPDEVVTAEFSREALSMLVEWINAARIAPLGRPDSWVKVDLIEYRPAKFEVRIAMYSRDVP